MHRPLVVDGLRFTSSASFFAFDEPDGSSTSSSSFFSFFGPPPNMEKTLSLAAEAAPAAAVTALLALSVTVLVTFEAVEAAVSPIDFDSVSVFGTVASAIIAFEGYTNDENGRPKFRFSLSKMG
jgi:hypothetical protein